MVYSMTVAFNNVIVSFFIFQNPLKPLLSASDPLFGNHWSGAQKQSLKQIIAIFYTFLENNIQK